MSVGDEVAVPVTAPLAVMWTRPFRSMSLLFMLMLPLTGVTVKSIPVTSTLSEKSLLV